LEELKPLHAIDRLEGYLLALLHTKHTKMFPLDQNIFYGQLYKHAAHKKYLRYMHIVDKVVFPFFPTCPVVHMSDKTKISRKLFLSMTAMERTTYVQQNLGQRLEVLLPWQSGYLWQGYRRRSRSGLRSLIILPTIPQDAVLYEYHHRYINGSGQEWYKKDLFLMDRESLYPLTWSDAPPYKDIRQELIENLTHHMMDMLTYVHYVQNLQQFWQVRWYYKHRQLIFGATDTAVKTLGALRAGPCNTPSGRRNPLLHWVSKHLRRVGNEEDERFIPISEHLRGIERFAIDEYSAEIVNPVKGK
jgi:hypothetical protein